MKYRMSAGQKVLFITGGGFHPFDACAKILKDFLEKVTVPAR